MTKILKLTILSHEKSHDLSKQIKLKTYSEPVIYTSNGNLDNYWYVYFSYRMPDGYLKRMPNIYAPKHLDKKDRLSYLKTIKRNLSEMLKDGFNPLDVYNSEIKTTKHTVSSAFKFALEIKKQSQNDTSYKNYELRIKRFENWILSKMFVDIDILNVNKKMANDYLNEILIKTSPRNRNNTKTDLQSLFQVLEDNDIIDKNFFVKIKKIKDTPERNKSYTTTQESDIFEYMQNKDPLLLLFVKMVSYNFLRPVEVCRLQIKDINIIDRTLSLRTKNKPVKIKIIPQIVIDELNIENEHPEHYLFTPTGVGEWEAEENNKRDYFSKRFLKVKQHFNLGKDYGLYSFRHTFISKLYNELIKEKTPFAAKSYLMLITGHSTMEALEKYLREIDAFRPEDYSEHFKKKD